MMNNIYTNIVITSADNEASFYPPLLVFWKYHFFILKRV